MSKFGKRLIESAEQAVAFAKGEADLKDYRVHIPNEKMDLLRWLRKR